MELTFRFRHPVLVPCWTRLPFYDRQHEMHEHQHSLEHIYATYLHVTRRILL